MIIIPAVDIKNGKCVQLVQGEPGTEQVVIENPAEVAKQWEQKGAKKLHIVDLDGALGSGRNLSIVKEIIEKTKPEFVISIHQNSFPDTSVSGAQVFYYGSEESVTNDSGSLAEYIQNALIRLQNPDNHRQAKANTSYYLLKNTTCPVVIVECGFLSNYSEESLLNDTAYQEKTASAICQGILDYINAN